MVGWGAEGREEGSWCGAVTRLELTGPSHTLRPRLRCVWWSRPPEERLEGLPFCLGWGSPGVFAQAWTLQEGQLHQTHVWLERGGGPAFLLG